MEASNPTGKFCGQCGAPLPADAPKGICPHCELQGALGMLGDGSETAPLAEPSTTDSDHLPPHLFGNYELLEEIARGGMGVVYRAQDTQVKRTVAIKTLPAIMTHNPDLMRRFQAEVQHASKLEHPNIVRVRQFFEANGTAYLVMDYYLGLSLGEHLERQGGRLPEDIAKRLMLPVLDGLRAVHAKGFRHRDIKPENIYLARTDSGGVRPILLDFGAARQAMSERSRSLSVVVSAGYAPLEQDQRRGKQGPWTDVYSAAAVLYRLVAGEPPPEAIERVSGDEIKPAASFGVSKRLSDALGKALATEARPQTIPEFQGRLWGAKPLQEPDRAPTSPIPSSAPTTEHRSVQSAPPASPEIGKGSASPAGSGSTPGRWLWPAVLAVAVVLIGLGAWYQYHQGQIEAQLRKAADDRAFETALGTNTDSAYRAYLSACAAVGCGHRPQAEQRLGELTAEAQTEADRMAREHAAQERAQQEAK